MINVNLEWISFPFIIAATQLLKVTCKSCTARSGSSWIPSIFFVCCALCFGTCATLTRKRQDHEIMSLLF